MAGFKRPTLKPTFEGEYKGFELEARRMTLEQLLVLGEMADLDTNDNEQVRMVWARVCKTLAQLVIHWNLLSDDGAMEPITYEVINSLDVDFVLAIANGLSRTVKVSRELGKDSTAGDQSVEGSLTMVPLSESQAS